MLLERIIDDPMSVEPETLKEMIKRNFHGLDRTKAVREFCAIFRKYRHLRWVENIALSSESEDICSAVDEWALMMEGSNPSVFYRFGRTGCELDGTPINSIYVFKNKINDNVLRIGSVCARKIRERNVFGEQESRYGIRGEDVDVLWDVDIRSMINWFMDKAVEEELPRDISSIVYKIRQDFEISEREKDIILNFYNETRKFKSSELVGEADLHVLRRTLTNFRRLLPKNLDDILFTETSVTRNQATPLISFVYEDGKRAEVLEMLRKDKNARRTIDLERTRLDFTHPPGIKTMGGLALSYIADYEKVNSGRRNHRLTNVILPIHLFNSGFVITSDDADQISSAYRTHMNYTIGKLEEDRDKRFMKKRAEIWSRVKTNYPLKRDVVQGFLNTLNTEIDGSPFADEMWRLINGVCKSRAAKTRTGYLSKADMIRDPVYRGFIETNFKSFLGAGYMGREFPIRDRYFHTENVEGNFPSVFMGEHAAYIIPSKLREIAYEDTGGIRDSKKAYKALKNRRLAFDMLQDLVMETIRRYRPRG